MNDTIGGVLAELEPNDMSDDEDGDHMDKRAMRPPVIQSRHGMQGGETIPISQPGAPQSYMTAT